MSGDAAIELSCAPPLANQRKRRTDDMALRSAITLLTVVEVSLDNQLLETASCHNSASMGESRLTAVMRVFGAVVRPTALDLSARAVSSVAGA